MSAIADQEWTTSGERPLEIAQIVWLHALAIESHGDAWDALELVQLAGNDRAVLQHALSHGHGLERNGSNKKQVGRAVRELSNAIMLLKPGGPSHLPIALP